MAAKNEDSIQRVVRTIRDRSLRKYGATSREHKAVLEALAQVRSEFRTTV